MLKALVSPQELGPNGSQRIAQVAPVNQDPSSGGIPFPVSAPLLWVDAPEGTTSQHGWDGASVVAPSPAAIGPDLLGFWQDLVGLAGGVVQLNTVLSKNYPTLKTDILRGDYATASTFFVDAKAKLVITAGQYTQIQGFAANRRLPLVLP